MIPSIAWSSGASSKTMLAALPPSSRVSFLRAARHGPRDHLADGRRAGEGDLVDVGMPDQLHPDLAGPGDDVHHARRQLGLAHDVGEEIGGQRGGGGGLQHRRCCPAASAGAIFQASISSGKFQGMICAATPSERGVAAREGVVELVRPAGVVEEVRRRQRHVDVARSP